MLSNNNKKMIDILSVVTMLTGTSIKKIKSKNSNLPSEEQLRLAKKIKTFITSQINK